MTDRRVSDINDLQKCQPTIERLVQTIDISIYIRYVHKYYDALKDLTHYDKYTADSQL